MNIIVKAFGGGIFVRPDTTLEKDNDNFYVPDFVNRIDLSPVIFARISKPGKYISEKFVGRYYESFNHGLLLYPRGLCVEDEEFAGSLCLDHTSYLPLPLLPAEALTKEERYTIEKAIVLVSTRCLLRTGDLVAVETERRKELCRRGEKKVIHLEKFDIIY